MPNKENIRKWVTALRSGEHEQGTGSLNENGKKCCLGVACIVAASERPDFIQVGEEPTHDNPEGGYRVTYDGEGGYLPTSVVGWLGLDTINPHVGIAPDDGRRLTATMANDTYHWSFSDIANAIEKTYLTE